MGFLGKIFSYLFSSKQNTPLAEAVLSGFPKNLTEAKALWSAENLVTGTLLNCGGGEFLAQSELGELHGTLHGVPADEELPTGTELEIFIRSDFLHLSECPAEENCFLLELESAGELAHTGNRWERTWLLDNAFPLKVSAPSQEELLCTDDSFAWILPEDLVAFIKK